MVIWGNIWKPHESGSWKCTLNAGQVLTPTLKCSHSIFSFVFVAWFWWNSWVRGMGDGPFLCPTQAISRGLILDCLPLQLYRSKILVSPLQLAMNRSKRFCWDGESRCAFGVSWPLSSETNKSVHSARTMGWKAEPNLGLASTLWFHFSWFPQLHLVFRSGDVERNNCRYFAFIKSLFQPSTGW